MPHRAAGRGPCARRVSIDLPPWQPTAASRRELRPRLPSRQGRLLGSGGQTFPTASSISSSSHNGTLDPCMCAPGSQTCAPAIQPASFFRFVVRHGVYTNVIIILIILHYFYHFLYIQHTRLQFSLLDDSHDIVKFGIQDQHKVCVCVCVCVCSFVCDFTAHCISSPSPDPVLRRTHSVVNKF